MALYSVLKYVVSENEDVNKNLKDNETKLFSKTVVCLEKDLSWEDAKDIRQANNKSWIVKQ